MIQKMLPSQIDNLTNQQRLEMTWPIEQVQDSQVVFIRAKQAEKDNRKLASRLNTAEKTALENYHAKENVQQYLIIGILSLAVGALFGLAYRSAGWEQWLLAGYLTAGITVSACILSTLWIVRKRKA